MSKVQNYSSVKQKKNSVFLHFVSHASHISQGVTSRVYYVITLPRLKGALNPNFFNLTINIENFCSRNVLVPFLNFLWLEVIGLHL